MSSPIIQSSPAMAPTKKVSKLSLFAVIAVALALVGLLVPQLLPWIKTPFIFTTAFGIAALGVAILVRAGQVSFGHAMYMCLSGYFVAYLSRWVQGLDTILLILAGTAFAALCGLVIGSFVVRYRTIFFGMLNLALSMVLFAALGKFYDYTGGTDGMRVTRTAIFGVELERDGFESALLYLSVGLAVFVGYAIYRYFRSPAGEALTAIKTNETRLEYVGISTYRVFLTGYVLSATLCGLAGSIFAISQGLVTPEMGYWVRSGEIVFISILGGVLHPVGAFIGSLIFEFVKLYAAAYITGAWQMTLGIVLLIMVFFAPDGVAGLLAKRVAKKAAANQKQGGQLQ